MEVGVLGTEDNSDCLLATVLKKSEPSEKSFLRNLLFRGKIFTVNFLFRLHFFQRLMFLHFEIRISQNPKF